MGLCQSTPAAVVSPEAAQANAKLPKVSTSATMGTETESERSQFNKSAASTPRLKPVYSSGMDSDTEHSKSSRLRTGYSSGESSSSTDPGAESPRERVHLASIKGSLRADGNFGSNSVRMETPLGKPIEQVYDGVHDGPVLGSGVTGIVRMVTHKTTGSNYAVKCLDLQRVNDKETLERLREEIYIMCQLDHPNIVRLEEAYESEFEIYLIQQLCSGGELFDRLDEQPDYHYTEANCAHLVKQMLSSLRYLHSKNIIHHDLKLENFLFSTTEPDSVLKMIDFGLSKHFHAGEVLYDCVGTPYSVAPEVILGPHTEKCDIWSIGVITYLLLSGETPFGGMDGEELLEVRRRVLEGKLEFEPQETWANVSELGKDFIKTLIQVDPSKRPSAKDAQHHEWIKTFSTKKGSEGNKLNPDVVNALVSFKELSGMQKLLTEVLSFTMMPSQISSLREEFEKMDRDSDGEITLCELKQVLMENAEAGSLGALTEEEIDEIFNAMRVNKSEKTIRWHEFIAAGLSQCEVDDRNLRLAFDRLDTEGTGFITFKNFMDMMGSGCVDNDEALQAIWMDTMNQCSFSLDRITYDDFVWLVKGQGKELQMSLNLEDSKNFASIPEGEVVEAANGIFISPRPTYEKQRSRSLDDTLLGRTPMSMRDTNSAFGESRSPLVVHRKMWRSHREMRLAVLAASKRFEEKRVQHGVTTPVAAKKDPARIASLSVRRGSGSRCKSYTGEERTLEQTRLDYASHRGGRGKTRVKTVSDMTDLLVVA